MAENVRPPVAIRIVRPYDTEDELLDNELETIGKTSVLLIGAHPRPTGVILRFEVTLASGATVLRGEGRVLAHKENAFRGQPGLSLRFTRLDPRSKAVVDRATAIRDARAQVEPAASSRPSRPPPAPLSDPAIADALTQSTPAPAPAAPARAERTPSEPPRRSAAEAAEEASARARAEANATARVNATRTRTGQLTPPPAPAEPVDEAPTPAPTPVTSVPGLVAEGPSPPPAAPAASSPPPAPHAAPAPAAAAAAAASTTTHRAAGEGVLEPPADRSGLLERLRKRAEGLDPARVEAILASRR